MKSQRKIHSADFKVRVALEAIRGHKTVNEIASKFGIHPNQVSHWKKLVPEGLPLLLSDKRARADKNE